MRHRRCDSDKYKRSQRRQRASHLVRVARRKEEQARHALDVARWRREQEEQKAASQRLRRQLISLIIARIRQVDPGYYNHWAMWRHLRAIIGIASIGGGEPDVINELLERYKGSEYEN